MEAKQADQTVSPSAEREELKESSDPALSEGAERGEIKLLSYEELYALWERQHWATQDLDFSQDRIDWHERFDDDERFQRMYGLASFFVGEQRVTDELGPIMRACPTESQRIFLSTQIADEARHVRFFDAFYEQVGVLESADLRGRIEESQQHLNDKFGVLFDEMLKGRVDRLAANPDDTECLVQCITLYHMVIEGMLALTGQHFIIDYNTKEGTLPGFVEGFNNVARDEHRHVAFGARFLREKAQEDPRYEAAITSMLQEALPVADAVLSPPWVDDPSEWELFGVTAQQTREFAVTALSRRLKVIGISLG
ncbi:MAG: ribonucleoside-diphosphate reductase beta chain [Solirubrobacterales bacterium]|nr:ribonucleoside-diphosphate reductase beta chain [Solirubrobacterales bacterium]MDX6662299.1 ribonucleoside-diphosphate reductase beta chain [Solirubrobacterales bacterium]